MISWLAKEWLVWRAQRCLRRNDYYTATNLLKRATRYSPRNPRVWIMLSATYSHDGDYENAEKTAHRALEISPNDPTYHLLLGQLYYDTDRYDAALQELDRCLEQQPENQLARNMRALTSYQAGHHEEALESFANTGLCNNYEFLSRFSAVFEKEIVQHPNRFPEPSSQFEEMTGTLLYRIYDFFRNSGLPGRVFKFLFIRRCFHRTTRLLAYRNFQGAIDVLDFILKLNPGNKDALSGIAIARYEQGNFDDAKTIFLGLLKDEMYEPLLLVYLGLCYYKTEKYNTALALFERVSNNRPEDYNSNYYAGLCHIALGDMISAIRAFERAYKQYFVDTNEQCLDRLLRRVLASPE